MSTNHTQIIADNAPLLTVVGVDKERISAPNKMATVLQLRESSCEKNWKD
jgi:hypothetical protein